MKTMKLGDSIKRVSEKDAEPLRNQGWSYCPKSEWKEKVRGEFKPKVTKETKEKKSKKKN
jgi:uncharacterized protein (DUF2249 family)